MDVDKDGDVGRVRGSSFAAALSLDMGRRGRPEGEKVLGVRARGVILLPRFDLLPCGGDMLLSASWRNVVRRRRRRSEDVPIVNSDDDEDIFQRSVMTDRQTGIPHTPPLFFCSAD